MPFDTPNPLPRFLAPSVRTTPILIEEAILRSMKSSVESRREFAHVAEIMFFSYGSNPSSRIVDMLITDTDATVLRRMAQCYSLSPQQCERMIEHVIPLAIEYGQDHKIHNPYEHVLDALLGHVNTPQDVREHLITKMRLMKSGVLPELDDHDELAFSRENTIKSAITWGGSHPELIESVIEAIASHNEGSFMIIRGAAGNTYSNPRTLLRVAHLLQEDAPHHHDILTALIDNENTPVEAFQILAGKFERDNTSQYVDKALARAWTQKYIADTIIPDKHRRERPSISMNASICESLDALIEELVVVESARVALAADLNVSARDVIELLRMRHWESAQALTGNWVEHLKGWLPNQIHLLLESCKSRLSSARTFEEWSQAIARNREVIDSYSAFEDLQVDDFAFIEKDAPSLFRDVIAVMAILFVSTKSSTSVGGPIISRHGSAHLGGDFYSSSNAITMSWVYRSLLASTISYSSYCSEEWQSRPSPETTHSESFYPGDEV